MYSWLSPLAHGLHLPKTYWPHANDKMFWICLTAVICLALLAILAQPASSGVGELASISNCCDAW